jgi:TRAP-type mannitol/chloroaromatic compound transport system substrate-binding protein
MRPSGSDPMMMKSSGFVKIAPYYCSPGWWEGCANGFLYINSAKRAELPKTYQQMVTTIAGHVAADLIAKYDGRNPPAIKRLAAAGADCARSRSLYWRPATRRAKTCSRTFRPRTRSSKLL